MTAMLPPSASPVPTVADLFFSPSITLLAKTRRWLHHSPATPQAPAEFATPGRTVAEFAPATLRVSGAEEGRTALIVPPEINGPQIADFGPGQSLVERLLLEGFDRVGVLCWRSANQATKDLGIDDSVSAIHDAVRWLGAPVTAVGICQGGWELVLAASTEPDLFSALVIGASPIDFHAGNSGLTGLARSTPLGVYEGLVALGGGVMRGDLLRAGFDALRPLERTWGKAYSLWNQVDDPALLERIDRLERWYGDRKDLPGQMYLVAIERLFQGNELVRGTMTVAGQRVDPRRIRCPVAMIAGSRDHITPKEQLFALSSMLGDAPRREFLADAGHVGIFVGHESLRDTWPAVMGWVSSVRQ